MKKLLFFIILLFGCLPMQSQSITITLKVHLIREKKGDFFGFSLLRSSDCKLYISDTGKDSNGNPCLILKISGIPDSKKEWTAFWFSQDQNSLFSELTDDNGKKAGFLLREGDTGGFTSTICCARFDTESGPMYFIRLYEGSNTKTPDRYLGKYFFELSYNDYVDLKKLIKIIYKRFFYFI